MPSYPVLGSRGTGRSQQCYAALFTGLDALVHEDPYSTVPTVQDGSVHLPVWSRRFWLRRTFQFSPALFWVEKEKQETRTCNGNSNSKQRRPATFFLAQKICKKTLIRFSQRSLALLRVLSRKSTRTAVRPSTLLLLPTSSPAALQCVDASSVVQWSHARGCVSYWVCRFPAARMDCMASDDATASGVSPSPSSTSVNAPWPTWDAIKCGDQ